MKAFELAEILPTYGIDQFGKGYLKKFFSTELNIPIENVPNKEGTHLLPKHIQIEITRIIRETKLSRFLKELYDNKCQICGCSIQLTENYYSEVHHLQPLGGDHEGPDDLSNMIVVCPNHHVQLDYGSIAIIPNNLRVINCDGKELGVLKVLKDHKIGNEFLEYHLRYIFLKGKGRNLLSIPN